MNNDELELLIRRTHPKPEFPSAFNREVWARVATEDRSWIARWRQAADAFFTGISRPAPAAALVMITLLMGAWLGNVTAPDSSEPMLRNAYIQSINPLTAAGTSVRE